MKKSVFWTIVRIAPFAIIALFLVGRIGQGSAQYADLQEALADMVAFTNKFQMNWITNMMESIHETLGTGWEMNNGMYLVRNMMGDELYVVFVQIIFETIAFIPKLFIKIMNKEKEKTRK